jgi:hypothetical protein
MSEFNVWTEGSRRKSRSYFAKISPVLLLTDDFYLIPICFLLDSPQDQGDDSLSERKANMETE